MMLRQQQPEERNGYRSITPRIESPPARRGLDRDTVEKVLETAAMLQDAEQNRLSVAEIEALAAKRGIAAHHVHQALGLHGHASARYRHLPRLRLTRNQWRVSAAALVLYWLLAIVLPFYYPATAAFIGLLPILLTAVLGFYLRYKRAGAAVGVAMTAVICSVLALATYARSGNLTEDLSITSIFIALALYTLPAVVAAALRQWISARQLPYEPTILRVSDLDR